MTKEQAQEYVKCRRDPVYFLKTYGKVKHPTKGVLDFALWDFQKDCMKNFLSNSYNVVLKARQLGLSTLCAGYASWLMLFFNNKEVYIIATKNKVATNLVSKVKFFFDNLPNWMRPYEKKPPVDNRQSIELPNGSKVQASGTTEDAGRSEALSLLIVDEAAFIKGMEDIWIAAQPTLSTGGDCIALSTPNGIGNWFHQIYDEATQGVKTDIGGGKAIGFNAIKLHWSLHPDRTNTWAENERKKIGTRAFAQEHDADFLQSGNNVIDYADLIWYEEHPTIQEQPDITERPYLKEPIEKTGFDKGFWLWRYPDYSKSYLVSADVARGDGSDFSACQVIDIDNYEQVAEYKGKLPTDMFGHVLVQIAVQFNNALLVIENNGPGWATIQKVMDMGYNNVYWTDKTRTFVDITRTQDIVDPWDKSKSNLVPGFTTSNKTRPAIIARMEEDIRNHDITIHSKRLVSEFQTYVYEGANGRPDHLPGYHDDLIMALAIGMYVRGTNLRMHSVGGDIQKTLLDNISFSNSPYEYGVIKPEHSQQIPDPLRMKTSQGDEDLRWLL